MVAVLLLSNVSATLIMITNPEDALLEIGVDSYNVHAVFHDAQNQGADNGIYRSTSSAPKVRYRPLQPRQLIEEYKPCPK
jgi:hypothetical protein